VKFRITVELPPFAVTTTRHVPLVAPCPTPPNMHVSALGPLLTSPLHTGATPTPPTSNTDVTLYRSDPPLNVNTPPNNGQSSNEADGVLEQ
jgi:hypothetical protein